MEKLLTNRSTCKNCLIFWKIIYSFWKVTADFCGGRKAKLISKSRSHIRFMNDCRNVAFSCGNYHWYCYEATFGKDYIRMKNLYKFFRFAESFDYTEWICKVLNAEIAAKFTG